MKEVCELKVELFREQYADIEAQLAAMAPGMDEVRWCRLTPGLPHFGLRLKLKCDIYVSVLYVKNPKESLIIKNPKVDPPFSPP